MEGESRRASFRGNLQLNQPACRVKPHLRPQFQEHVSHPGLLRAAALPSPCHGCFFPALSLCLYSEPEQVNHWVEINLVELAKL